MDDGLTMTIIYQLLIIMYSVYLLKSLKDNNYYVGYTNNVSKRFRLHNEGKVTSTKNRRPFKLVGFRKYRTRREARWFEYNLKKHGDKKKMFIEDLEKSN